MNHPNTVYLGDGLYMEPHEINPFTPSVKLWAADDEGRVNAVYVDAAAAGRIYHNLVLEMMPISQHDLSPRTEDSALVAVALQAMGRMENYLRAQREALQEISVGLQYYMAGYGEYDGKLTTLLKEADKLLEESDDKLAYPTIYLGWIPVGGGKEVVGQFLAEDGQYLGQCRTNTLADLKDAIITDERIVAVCKSKYPQGYRIEVVEDPTTDVFWRLVAWLNHRRTMAWVEHLRDRKLTLVDPGASDVGG